MFPSILARQIKYGLADYFRQSFASSSSRFSTSVEDFLRHRRNLFKGPYLTLEMPYRLGESAGEFFPDIPLGFQPYRHQELAFRRVAGKQPGSTIIATGTGSGKTECFTWPILDNLIRNRSAAGIKAILIYPMNALATDQARRLASIIWKTPKLKGRTRVGLYVYAEPPDPTTTMSDTEVITSRAEMQRSPPDILITNYKMLDYLLVRPRDKPLFADNGPETLRFLVVDELHTFDGAQGTDLACLIRRLKARLDCPGGHLRCVGTSATIGDENSKGIRDYASQVFGEHFDEDAVITEDRVAVSEYLYEKEVALSTLPEPASLETLFQGVISPSSLIAALYELWFDEQPDQDVASAKWRCDLATQLEKHVFFQDLLRRDLGQPTSYFEICRRLRQIAHLRHYQDHELELFVDAMAVLISHARSNPENSDGAAQAHTRPFLNLRVQLWIREMRRMVASVSDKPELIHHDDLNSGDVSHLPIVHCKECGETGWIGVKKVGDNAISTTLGDIYREFFQGNSRSLKYLLSPKPDVSTSEFAEYVSICTNCLEYSPAKHSSGCSCKDKKVLDAHLYSPQTYMDGDVSVSMDCPICGNGDGMQILGARSTTLLGVAQSILFASDLNNDPKLLAFSDSVQDAALRAGFFEARSFSSVFRASLRKFVAGRQNVMSLEELLEEFPESLRKDGDAPFVATFIPQDLQWRREFEGLLETGRLDREDGLLRDLGHRLEFEAFAELTFRSQYTHALETLGLLCVHPDISVIERVAADLEETARDRLGDTFARFSKRAWFSFALVVVERMRLRGAVITDRMRGFLKQKANWYGFRQANRLIYTYPKLSPRAPKPSFPSSRKQSGFDYVYARSTVTNWYAGWADKFFLKEDGFAPSSYADVYELVFELLQRHGLVEKETVGVRPQFVAWGLRPNKLIVCGQVQQMRCDRCHYKRLVPEDYAESWSTIPCARQSCEGVLRLSAAECRGQYSDAVYRGGRIRRVIAREHTGLLDRKTRTSIEQGFMKSQQSAWDPNLLSATPTLELGIDIGDLSTVALCSVPPSPSNYIQRIGRSGRRDGNSLNLAVATGRPHDLYFWADPQDMLLGTVRPPGVHLKATEILKRQLAAFSLDQWNQSTNITLTTLPKLGPCLDAIAMQSEEQFPLPWLTYLRANSDKIVQKFVSLFPELEANGEDTRDRLAEFASGPWSQLEKWISHAFTGAQRERQDLRDRFKEAGLALRRLRRAGLDLEGNKKAAEELTEERKALRSQVNMLGKRDILGFLTDVGILPNYAFPEAGIHLKSILRRLGQASDGKLREPKIFGYVRPASAGLRELAPGAYFYAEKHRVRIDELNVSRADIETFRFCPRCSYMTAENAISSPVDVCPSCNDTGWQDLSQRKKLIRLHKAVANGDITKSRIGDTSEGRRSTYFRCELIPLHGPEAIEYAYKLEDAASPFGFEFVGRCMFREVNFGRLDYMGEHFRFADHTVSASPFKICTDCGKALNLDVEGQQQQHSPYCPSRRGSRAKSSSEHIGLYREFSTEAVRILLPVGSIGVEEKCNSFVAGLNLGLRLHYEGNVDHIKHTISVSSVKEDSRRILYLYDAVPGGTGYLKQLLAQPDELRQVFEKAYSHMQSCKCTEDWNADGCYNCVYAYGTSYHQASISRQCAAEMLAEILENWHTLQPAATIDDIRRNEFLESELEVLFIERLKKDAARRGGVFREMLVNGKPGYILRVEKDSPTWEIEPQVRLLDGDVSGIRTQADFLIRPRRASKRKKPIAVYVDGWTFHRVSISSDFSKRLTLIHRGEHLVWALGYDDLAAENVVAATNTGHLGLFNGCSIMPAQLQQVFGEESFRRAKQILGKSSVEQLYELLASPDDDIWNQLPNMLSWSVLFSQCAKKEEGELSSLMEDISGVDIESYLEVRGEHKHFALLADGGVALVASLPTPLASDRSLPTILYNNMRPDSPEAKQEWLTALHALNLMQFSPSILAVTKSDPEAIYLRLDEQRVEEVDDDWTELFELIEDDMRTVVGRLRAAGTDIPEVGYEFVAGSRVTGEAELAWPKQKVAVVQEDQVDVARLPDWKVLESGPVIENPDILLQQLGNERQAGAPQ